MFFKVFEILTESSGYLILNFFSHKLKSIGLWEFEWWQNIMVEDSFLFFFGSSIFVRSLKLKFGQFEVLSNTKTQFEKCGAKKIYGVGKMLLFILLFPFSPISLGLSKTSLTTLFVKWEKAFHSCENKVNFCTQFFYHISNLCWIRW
jgi:hypothetical protein